MVCREQVKHAPHPGYSWLVHECVVGAGAAYGRLINYVRLEPVAAGTPGTAIKSNAPKYNVQN